MLAETLAQEILQRREQKLKSEAKVSRQVCPRASSIGECDREMFYSITQWQLKPPPEPILQARFDKGKQEEQQILKELIDLGFEVAESQMLFELKDKKGKVILTGSIDGKALWKDKRVPFEIKSLDPNIFSQIETPEDFNRYSWARRYPRQMQAYLYGHNAEEGLFILTNLKGSIKVMPIMLDYVEMEKILQRCEYIMDCVEKNELPDFYKDASVCRRCWALGRVCNPPMDFGPGAVVDDPEMEVKLAKWNELKPTVKEFDELDKEIKAYFKGKPLSLCGNFEIIGQERIMKLKAQEAREVKSWVIKIEPIERK